MKRFIDEKYHTYTPYTVIKTGIDVKCPQCGQRGIVSKQEGIYRFSCTECTKTMKKEQIQYRYDVHNHCENCGRYYRVDIKEEKQKNYPALHVACPHCEHVMQGKIQKTKKEYCVCYEKIENGYESIFGLELWFCLFLIASRYGH